MSLNLGNMKAPKAKGPRLEEGTYMARLSSVVDLGIQPMTDYQTQEPTAPKPRAILTWTLPTETIDKEDDDGTVTKLPRVMSKEYTLSNHEKSNLMKLIQALNPQVKDLSELLGSACMVGIGSTKTGNAKIASVMKAPDSMPIEEVDTLVQFDFDNPDEELFKSLPFWMQEKITEAKNYNGFADGWVESKSDDLPF